MDGSSLVPKAVVEPLNFGKDSGVKIIKKTLASGEIRYYYRWRKTGEQMGDSTDHAAVQNYYDRLTNTRPSPAAPVAGTFDMLVRDYCASDRFKFKDNGEPLGERTKSFYRDHMVQLQKVFGHLAPTEITGEILSTYLDTLADIPTTCYHRLKVMRMIFNWQVGRRKYGITYSVPEETRTEKPKPREKGWKWEDRKKMYDGLPEDQRCQLYKSISVRERQKLRLRNELRRLGVIGEKMSRKDYGKTIEQLNAMYLAACEKHNETPKKIYDGLSILERAAKYPLESFTPYARGLANERHAYMRMASVLTYYLGQRREDLLMITRHNECKQANPDRPKYLFEARDEQGRLWVFAHIHQGKTGAIVEVPFPPKLLALLHTHEWRGDFLLGSPKRGLWGNSNFSQCWREECELLGIQDVHQHDMRRTLNSDLQLAGCIPVQQHAVTGHDLKKLSHSNMARTYTLENRQHAVNAMVKLIEYEIRQDELRARRAEDGTSEDDVGKVSFLIEPKRVMISPPTKRQIKRRLRDAEAKSRLEALR